ncbi:MAG: XamI family restriction endonuclease [Thermomicrobiales bacterium]
MSVLRQAEALSRTLWTSEELDADRLLSEEQFRGRWLEEPLDEYLNQFDLVQLVVEDFLDRTDNLARLEEHALVVLSDPDRIDAFRYLAAPPISIDDLMTLVETNTLAPQVLREHGEIVRRLVQTIRTRLDRSRFPWVAEGREPSPVERKAAVVATTTLIATRRAETARRKSGKQAHGEQIRRVLLDIGMSETTVPGGVIDSMIQAPKPGQFCRKIVLGTRKADFVVGLWDGRLMPIECTVSNSAVNSINGAGWISDLGRRNVVPTAVLSGTYNLYDLELAQSRGLTIYWAHRLSDLTDLIEQTQKRQ